MKSKESPIGDILKSVFHKLEKEKKLPEEQIMGGWKELVGEKGFQHSKPWSLKKKILTVYVDSSAWIQELTLQKRKLLKGLKRKLGKDKISDIHFKIGEF